MAIEAKALRALSEKATQGEWHHCQPFKSVPAVNTVNGRVPVQRVDYVSTWPARGTPPGHRVIIPMEGRECQVSSDDMAFIAALVSAYRKGSLIHRSALAEDTALAAEGQIPEGWKLVPERATKRMLDAAYAAHDAYEAATGPAAWCGLSSAYSAMLAAAPALPTDKEAADANR